ncbi:MAG: hypothetical protein OXG33_10575 [Chloroflexi bacterium]|nr:hypothetical protein [Chloroflexota bacterium]
MQVVRNFGTLGLRLNLLWFLAALPLLPAVGVPVAIAVQQAASGFDSPQTPLILALALLGATVAACLSAGPATMALVQSAARFVQGDEIGIADFWRALRRHWPRGWLVLYADLLVLYALVFGFYFYLNSGQLPLQALAFVALYLTLVWVGAQAYLFPLVIRPEVSLQHAFLGAFAMALGRVGPSAAFVVVATVAIGVSVAFVLPLMVLAPVTLALVGHRMAHDRFGGPLGETPETEPGYSRPAAAGGRQ